MHPWIYPITPLRPLLSHPVYWGQWIWCLCIQSQTERREPLKKADNEKRYFIVSKLHHSIQNTPRRQQLEKLTCCPRHIRGPALKGVNMNGFFNKYFAALSSKNRSGSNSNAKKIRIKVITTGLTKPSSPSGPQRSVRLCIKKTE